MNSFRMHLASAVSCVLLSGWAVGQNVSTPKVGSPLRKQILDAFRVRVEKTIGLPVVFKPFTFNVWRGWAFVIAQPVHPNGSSIDYRKTRLRKQYAEERDVWSDEVEGLLHRTSGGWKIVHYRYDFGDFDGNDLTQKYGLPDALVKAPSAGL